MPTNIVLPSLSAGMEDGVIARWLKAEGEWIEKGAVIAEVETDKATMELEAQGSGRIGGIFVASGERAAVNQIIAVLLGEGEDAGDLSTPAAPAAATEPAPETPVAQSMPVSGDDPSLRIKASPLARRIARDIGIELDGLSGSGPRGRIVRIDVEQAKASAAVAAPPSAAETAQPAASASIPAEIGEHEVVAHTTMRGVIARRLTESKTTIPHFYLTADCAIDALVALREQINSARDASERISINDLVIKAAVVALQQVPDANVVWTEKALLRLKTVDISVAVATEGGLLTPVVRDAGGKSVGTISREIRALAARAREGRLKPEEYQGGGFSVSNLGMYGVQSFAAIINPPQSCILAVGGGERRAVVRGDEIVPATMMTCTLSVDHRCVDGAVGATLLAAFRSAIETPMRLLV